VGTRNPGRAASMLPRISGPGLVTRFSRTRNGLEPPDLLTRSRVVSRDKSAYPVFSAGDADDHFIFDHQRRVRQRIAELRITDLSTPDRTSRPGVDRDQAGVDGAHEQSVAEDRQATVHRAAADPRVGRRAVFIHPET